MGIKKERYSEAFSRIDSSIMTGHYFEAITIEESIISDRIASFLCATDSLKNDDIYRQNFVNLILLWKLATKNPGSIWEECETLIGKVDSWRKERNKYVHSLVKFPNQKANVVETSIFIKGAKSAAVKGKVLSNEVSEWRKRQSYIKRKHNLSLKPIAARGAAPA
jgi:hypothetical protein